MVVIAPPMAAYSLWQPGLEVSDGRHDRGRNGVWLQHGWLGDDSWFERHKKETMKPRFRDDRAVSELHAKLLRHNVSDVFPHLCPAEPNGSVPPIDPVQATRFLRTFADVRVMPWIGGVFGHSARARDPQWRQQFVRSVAALLNEWPQLSGVHLNIEPCPSGEPSLLALLEELRRAMPAGKVLSVAAYPPPTVLHPFPEVHWDERYFREVAALCDQVVVMMYDTAIRHLPKLYENLLAAWTREVLAWSGKSSVLIGLPAYDDSGSGYHEPHVENLERGLRGVHRGLHGVSLDSTSYQGVAIYSEWAMSELDWEHLRRYFVSPPR